MEETLQTIDTKIVECDAILENTRSGLYLLNEQLKTVSARRDELSKLRGTLSQNLPTPVVQKGGIE